MAWIKKKAELSIEHYKTLLGIALDQIGDDGYVDYVASAITEVPKGEVYLGDAENIINKWLEWDILDGLPQEMFEAAAPNSWGAELKPDVLAAAARNLAEWPEDQPVVPAELFPAQLSLPLEDNTPLEDQEHPEM